MTETPRAATPVDAIAERWVDRLVSLSPETGTYIGHTENDRRLSDYSPDGAAELDRAARATLTELRSAPVRDSVDEVTVADLSAELSLACTLHEAGWTNRDLNVIASPAQGIREVFDLMSTDGEEAWSTISARLKAVAPALDGYIETLRLGIRTAHTPALRQVREVAAQAEKNAAPNGFFSAFAHSAPETLPASLRAETIANAERAASGFAKLAAFLATELAPAASESDAVGRDLYALHSERFLGDRVDLDETYEWGVDELRRMVDEQEKIAREILPGASVAEAIAHLESDATRKLHGTAALQKWMQEVSDRAVAELGATHFDIPEEIRVLECMIAPTQEGGIYYTGPTDDFSRPGRMWWSVPEGVTEFDTWRELTTVYHEGIPGHHLQIGQAVYNRARLNTWRRQLAGTSGHAEGWALYAERLMESLGYLDDPADRLGMLDGQRLRAARVVLDIGVHLGKPRLDGTGVWDAHYAHAFLSANVNMSPEFVRFELSRYLGWPGQAPAYKVGQRVWEQLRDDAAQRAGADFDIKTFHRDALDIGGVRLDTLRSAISDH